MQYNLFNPPTVEAAVVRFLQNRISYNAPEFSAQDLRKYVGSWHKNVAPGTTDRILRMVRKRGLANYQLVSRRNSLYRAVPVAR